MVDKNNINIYNFLKINYMERYVIMSIEIKHYPQKKICNEFYAVINFLKIHGAKGYNKNWHWGRWEWLLGHSNLDESTLSSIGLFMDNDEIVVIVTHDMRIPTYILLNPNYNYLKPKMVDYAFSELSQNGVSKIYVDENDMELISVVKQKGYSITADNEYILELDCKKRLSYSMDKKYCFTDYYTDKNIDKYVAVIHKGFGNKGEPRIGLTESDFFHQKPHRNPKLVLFIVAPDGAYAAHCGTWYSEDTEICYVEPVVTIPEFRRQGLGKAVVYECINRCIEMGAKKALVISNQQFYYNLGFKAYSTHNLYEKKV
jgi:GNAT superfamily N-acetyltransferase